MPPAASSWARPAARSSPRAEALSFWGGVDPATARVIDVHHPLHGTCLTGGILMMPSSRGSCTGSGVLLDMVLSGRAPAALVFSEAEDVLTLGALIATEMFGKPLPVLRLAPDAFAALSRAKTARITDTAIEADGLCFARQRRRATAALDLTEADRAMLDGRRRRRRAAGDAHHLRHGARSRARRRWWT